MAESNPGVNDKALVVAAREGGQAEVQRLLEKGADVEAKDGKGWTALLKAVHNGHEAVVKLLIENGADIKVRDGKGWTALLKAVDKGHDTVVKVLIENGADVEAKDGYGCTALLRAASHGHDAVVKVLLENGANIEAKDAKGSTAISKAIEKGHDAVVKLLRESMTNVKAKDGKGWTAVVRAPQGRHDAVVKPSVEGRAAQHGDVPEWRAQQHLCIICRSINFKEFLLNFSDSEDSDDAGDTRHVDNSSDGTTVELGDLNDLIRRAPSCQFCALILDAAKRICKGGKIEKADKSKRQRMKCQLKSDPFCIFEDPSPNGRTKEDVGVSRIVVEFEPRLDELFSKSDLSSSDSDSSSSDSDPSSSDAEDSSSDADDSSSDADNSSSDSDASYLEEEIKFQAYREPKSGVEAHKNLKGFGRKLKPLVDRQILRNWIRQCEDRHGNKCHAPKWLGKVEQPSCLKVIDVERRCIINAPRSCRYLALSYVWGNDQSGRCEKRNITKFRKKNGLSGKDLPKTIEDAMELVSALGERYLWVDRLCITQDDNDDKAEQLPKMDLIYSGAVVTIIVAAGKGAASGLPGIREGSRKVTQGTLRVGKNLFLMHTVAQGSSGHLQYSKWNTRGWTFQERLMSRRALIFTPDQVFWNCESVTWNEETVLEPEEPACDMLPGVFECNDEWLDEGELKFSSQLWSTYIVQYSTRQLTDQSDAQSAFSGILRRMEYTNNELYHWGLPHTRFDQAISWLHGSTRREQRCRLGEVTFPSWSWLGWTGFISAPIFHERLHEQTLQGKSRSELVFYKLGAEGRVEEIKGPALISNTAQAQDRDLDKDPYQDLRQQWKGPTKVQEPVTIKAKGSRSLSKPLTSNDIATDTTTNRPFRDTSRIVFWTSHARIAPKEILKISSGELITPRSGKAKKKDSMIDCIVVSRRCEFGKELAVLNLLVVEWSKTERNVANRIGVVRIMESDWVTVDREWKLVILE
jgi:hypothetical protein